ncbi:MAG: S8 family serine peptidase [Anaerolineae bacterium]|nr:S8 family serine peptidase [Anaerolineae bacterium]
MKRSISIVILFVLVTAVFSISAQKSSPTHSFVIQAASVAQASEIVHDYGGQVQEELPIINAVSAAIPANRIAALSADGQVLAVFTDGQVEAAGFAPDMAAPEVMGVPAVWNAGYEGDGIGVAVVDSGIGRMVWNHGRIVARYDALDNGPQRHDAHGHGTMMASLIANNRMDSNGTIGVAPEVNLIDVRVLDEEGKGTYTDIIEGLNWILQNKDAYNIRVVNLSLVGGIDSPYWADPINQSVEALWAAGIVVVAAAGNDGPGAMSIAVPGNDPFVITVGAYTDNFHATE